MASILTSQQAIALKLLAQTDLADTFYFSGGTALAHYYLQHRTSEDLDFFRAEEFDPQSIVVRLQSFRTQLGYTDFHYENSFNRNLYFLHFKNGDVLKLEFTYYPFPQIEVPMKKDGLLIDSVLDIAVNKLFTIAQKARGRDYYDLFCISQKYTYNLEKLRTLAKQKFDWHIDPLQLATRLDAVDHYLDDPILNKKFDQKKLIHFFQQQALGLREQIVK